MEEDVKQVPSNEGGYYASPRTVRATEALLVQLTEKNDKLITSIHSYRSQVESLKSQLDNINRYDKDVQTMISAHPALEEAWDSFRVTYQMLASKELLTSGYLKSRSENSNINAICPTCGTKSKYA